MIIWGLFSQFLPKNIFCGYSLKDLAEALLMSIGNILRKLIPELSLILHLNKSSDFYLHFGFGL